jgi:hypothetical protein
MAVTNEEKTHGVVFLKILKEIDRRNLDIKLSLFKGVSSSSYILSSNHKTLGLFIKYSTKRRSPWRYSFHKEHQEEINMLSIDYKNTFVIFVNGDDGILSLSYSELKNILDENYEDQEWVAISRKPRELYRISGKDGKIDRPISSSKFPDGIVEYLSN